MADASHAASGPAQRVSELERNLAERETEIALLTEVSQAVSTQLDLDTVFQLAAEHARRLIRARNVLIPVVNADCTEYTYRAGCGDEVDEIVGESLSMDYGVCGWVWRHQRAWWRGVLDDLDPEERERWREEIDNVVLVPLIGRRHFLGGLAGIGKQGGGGFDQRDVELLKLFASQVSIAIENAAMFEEAVAAKAALEQRIAAQERVEAALHAEKERAVVTLSAISDAVITTDTGGVVAYLNPAAQTLMGDMRQVAGRRLVEVARLVDEASGVEIPDPVRACLLEGRTVRPREDLTLKVAGRAPVGVELTASPLDDRAGEHIGAVLVLRDVSEARELGRRIAHQAAHDALTGLINRREFETRLERALRSARHQKAEHCVLYMDLDQFKVINDTCGHAAGDELLRQITHAIDRVKRRRDTLARLGGDEFGMLLEHCPRHAAMRIAEDICAAVRDYRFIWEDKAIPVTISIGVIPIDNAARSLRDVMSLVDTACYMAKESGRNRVHLYREDDTELQRRRGEMHWVAEINRALEENRLTLHYQPIAPLQPGEGGTRLEILVRMHDAGGELVPPGAFLPAAEHYGLMQAVDRWVFDAALAWLATSPALLADGGCVSINLGGSSVSDPNFLSHVQRGLAAANLAPGTLCFEITETEAIANLSRAVEFIETLRALGCVFALDDFGSGFASYAHLKHLPVDYLKIDGSFVRDVVDDAASQAMVESITHIAHVLGKRTIAEFVESEAILEKVRALGVDYAQGYGIAIPRPLPGAVAPARPEPVRASGVAGTAD